MKRQQALIASAVLGAGCGLLSTFPLELGPMLSILLWTVGGLIVGWLTQDQRTTIQSGVVYGMVLTSVFLFSRFGGTPDHILQYALFVAVMSIGGAIGGLVTAFIGAWLRKRI